MLRRKDKEKIVDELVDRFKRQHIMIFSDLHGVSVVSTQALRRTLKTVDAEYKMTKKTLLRLALEKSGVTLNIKELHGEIGVVFGYGEETAPAKIVMKFKKGNETFKVLGGLLQGKMLQEKEIVNLSKLPSREVLLAQVLGAMQSPMRGLATVLGANIRNLVVVLDKVKNKK